MKTTTAKRMTLLQPENSKKRECGSQYSAQMFLLQVSKQKLKLPIYTHMERMNGLEKHLYAPYLDNELKICSCYT